MARRLDGSVACVVFFVACGGGGPGTATDAAAPDGAGVADAAGGAACQPVTEERGQCRPPLDTGLCAATWETRDPPMCGLRIYEGPGAGYLLQYVSYADVPAVGGPSWMCVYDTTTHALVGVWALDHYLRWCCASSLDMFQGVGSDDIAAVAIAMAAHPPCP
jgi:hypothetical protein